MIVSEYTLFIWANKYPNKRYKTWEIQLTWDFDISLKICPIDIDLSDTYWKYLSIMFFDLISIYIQKTYEDDHAGIYFTINLFGLKLHINYFDIRHWDDVKDTWEKCAKPNECKRCIKTSFEIWSKKIKRYFRHL